MTSSVEFWLAGQRRRTARRVCSMGRGSVRGVVQLAHGMSEHTGRYARTIDILVSAD
jgi:alpha-beta hydrolase superfamily lysophospholipase